MTGLVAVASLHDLQGRSLSAFEIDGESLAVANVGGSFHVFADACPHRQCSLAEGVLNDTVVTCPCHGSQFDVTSGERLRGPAARGVRSYRARLEDSVLMVEL